MEQKAEYQAAMLESIVAGFWELREFLKESEAQSQRESKRLEAEYYRQLAASRVEFDRRMQEDREKREASEADFNRRMKKVNETLGAWGNNQGAFAEDYFFNSFENGKRNFFGEEFDRIDKNLKHLDYVIKDEYDIVMVNGKSVAIVEVKYTANDNDIPRVIRKAETFRVNHPRYVRHKIYLGLASLSFYPLVEQQCKSEGIAVIKQVGDTVVINDAHLRAC